MMPGMDGYTVCKEMREDAFLKEVPIIFLTAKNKVEDKIVGLSVGGDDYLGKPFNINELLLRVKAILRRTKNLNKQAEQSGTEFSESTDQKTRPIVQPEVDPIIRIGEYSLNTRTYMFSSPKKGKFRLTPVQYTLLYHLMTHPNKIFSPSLLLDEAKTIFEPTEIATEGETYEL
jgi:DNA-binding response OmpR family regulator